MKLDDFVAETLNQIIKGVIVAQNFGLRHDANVNPASARFHSATQGQTFCQNTGVPLQNVEFDVAVTVSEGQSKSEGDTSVGSISVSAANVSNLQNSSISRIRFSVPVRLPTTGES